MGQGLLRARALASLLYLPHCARIYPARGSNVPKHRRPHQCPTTSYTPRIWGSESSYGVCPSNITIARLDTDGFGVGGKQSQDHPLWVTNDLRVTAGTSIDLTLRPHPLTQKEDLLLLSLWRRHCQVPKGCALGTWLRGTDKELGPDNDESPHKLAP